MINHQRMNLNPSTNIVYVKGETGLNNYPVAIGYTLFAMDTDEQKFYIKAVDAAGITSTRKFNFEEIIEEKKAEPQFVTKDDFADFENKILALLQPPVKPTKKGGEADA